MLRLLQLVLLSGLCIFALPIAVLTAQQTTTSKSILQDQQAAERLEQLENDMQLLQRQVYKSGGIVSNVPGVSPMGVGNAGVADEQIRSLTGRIEQLEYKITKLTTTVDTLNDMVIKMQAASLPAVPTTSSEPNLVTTPIPLDQVLPGTTNEAIQSPVIIDQGTPKTNETGDKASASDAATKEYETALSLLRQNKYAESEKAFTQFITAHASHQLMGSAYYWLGETYAVQKKYQQAAIQFLRGYKKQPKGPKAADNLLKLSYALGGMNKTSDACATLKKLDAEFPDSSNAIKIHAQDYKKQFKCT